MHLSKLHILRLNNYGQQMILTGLNITNQVENTIYIERKIIKAIKALNATTLKAVSNELIINFSGAYAFPGLINSHDHLDFNLFEQYKSGPYHNYLEWGKAIHTNFGPQIKNILKIPKRLRVQWGIYKNLISGVTTVVQHGEKLTDDYNLINIYQASKCIHSTGLESLWKLKLNNPFSKKSPVVVHLGEGTDLKSKKEINDLLRWNFTNKNIIAVHGIAMDHCQANGFKGLIWCPDSNTFLYGQTAAVNELKKVLPIVFGTDSTLSSHWDIWTQLRQARKTGLLNEDELINSVGPAAAKLWNLTDTGKLQAGFMADIIIVANSIKAQNNMEAFFAAAPEQLLLVLGSGQIKLFDHSLLPQMPNLRLKEYSKVFINGREKYVLGPLTQLIARLSNYNINLNLPITTQ